MIEEIRQSKHGFIGLQGALSRSRPKLTQPNANDYSDVTVQHYGEVNLKNANSNKNQANILAIKLEDRLQGQQNSAKKGSEKKNGAHSTLDLDAAEEYVHKNWSRRPELPARRLHDLNREGGV